MEKLGMDDNGEMSMKIEMAASDWEFILREASDVNLIKGILNYVTDVDAKDSDGYTALHYAVINNDQDKTRLLIEHGANVNARARYGISPLLICSFFEYAEMSDFLIKNNAEKNYPKMGALARYWIERMFKVYNPVNVKFIEHCSTKAGIDDEAEVNMLAYYKFGKRARRIQLKRIKKALDKAAAIAGFQYQNEASV